MTTRPMLTQREAAAACGTSRTTIRRRREDGALPNAVRDPVRGWLIPVEDLLAAGFRLHAPSPPDAPPAAPRTSAAGEASGQEAAAELRAALDRARLEHAMELREAEHGRELAEAEARHLQAQLEERDQRIEDLQQALKALMPAPERTALTRPSEAASVPLQNQGGPDAPPQSSRADDGPSSSARRPRWWKRG